MDMHMDINGSNIPPFRLAYHVPNTSWELITVVHMEHPVRCIMQVAMVQRTHAHLLLNSHRASLSPLTAAANSAACTTR